MVGKCDILLWYHGTSTGVLHRNRAKIIFVQTYTINDNSISQQALKALEVVM